MEVMTRNSERFPGLSGISPPPKNSQTRQSGQPGLPVRIKDSASRMRTERGPPSAMALSPRAYRLLMARGLVYEESVPHRLIKNAGLVERGLVPAVPTDGSKNEHFYGSNFGVMDRRRQGIKDFHMPAPAYEDVDTTKLISRKAIETMQEDAARRKAEDAYQAEHRKLNEEAEKERIKKDLEMVTAARLELSLHTNEATRANNDHIGSDFAPVSEAHEYGLQPLHASSNLGVASAGVTAHEGVRKVHSDMVADHLGIGLGHMQPDKDHDMHTHAFGDWHAYGAHIGDVAHQLHRERRALRRPAAWAENSTISWTPNFKHHLTHRSGMLLKYDAKINQMSPKADSHKPAPKIRVPSHIMEQQSKKHNLSIKERVAKIAVTPPWLSSGAGSDPGRFKRALTLPVVKGKRL
eukprot:m.96529 g.96529  ORF g.96529 m.96529 type:complete len:408 (-) comp20477_c1_seq1:80-1303(-)